MTTDMTIVDYQPCNFARCFLKKDMYEYDEHSFWVERVSHSMHLDKDFLTIPQIPPHSWKYQITPLSLENIKFEVCILSLHCQC